MCGRYTFGSEQWINYQVALGLASDHVRLNLRPNYDARPTQSMPIVRMGENGPELSEARWGLVPFFWSKPIKEMKFSTFNAKSEAAAKAPSFREAFKRRRCIVPADGFYEWTGKKDDKQRWYFSPTEQPKVFRFAGLWDQVVIEGETVESFTILTCEPNDMTRKYHNRMPVILTGGEPRQWLNFDAGQELMKPCDSDLVQVHEVARVAKGSAQIEPLQ